MYRFEIIDALLRTMTITTDDYLNLEIAILSLAPLYLHAKSMTVTLMSPYTETVVHEVDRFVTEDELEDYYHEFTERR